MNSGKQIKLGAVISYITIVFNIIAGLIYTPWMIASIGKDNYALYTLALSIINIFLLDFGIGSSVTRFLSEYYAKGMRKEAEQFMGIVYKVFFVISAIIAFGLIIFYFLIDILYGKLSPSEIIIFKHLFIIVGAYSVISFPCTVFKGVLMANEKFVSVKLCGLGQKVTDTILIIFFLLSGKGVYAMVLVHAFSNMLFHAIRYLIIRIRTKQRSQMHSWNKTQARSLFGYSVWITIISISQRCIFNIMPSLIAALIGSAEVTLFSLAATLEGYVYTFADAINGMFMPRISRIFASDNSENKINDLMCRVGKFHVYTIGLIIIGFICLGQRFVKLWLGSGYESVYICAVILMIPSLIDVPQQVARTSLLTLNIVKQQAYIYISMAVINILISLFLVPDFGAVGASIAVCCAYLFRTFMFNVLYKKKLPVRLGQYFRNVYLKWGIAAIASLVTGSVLDNLIPKNGVFSFLILGIVVVIIYAVLIYVFDIDKKTKSSIKNNICHFTGGKL